jgi:transposase
VISVGIDWGEATNAVAVIDGDGTVLAQVQVQDNIKGLGKLIETLARYSSGPDEVVVGTETEHGLLIRALISSGYRVYPINPMSAQRYRDRVRVSGAKSDPGDALVLANAVRTDWRQHRPVSINSDLADAIKVLARRHQDLIRGRAAQTLRLRSALREYYPGALEAFGASLNTTPCLAILERAPTPQQGKKLSKASIATTLRKAGRQRMVADLAAKIHEALQVPQLEEPPEVAEAWGEAAASMARLLMPMNVEIERLEDRLEAAFRRHPDAEVILSLSGTGVVLGARLLAEFGDQPNRYADSKSRKSFSGMAPLTRSSGKHRTVSRRFAKKRRLADACFQWADCARRVSPGAKLYYGQLRSRGLSHASADRALANRLVGIYHGCLKTGTRYDETTAWARFHPPSKSPVAAATA